MIQLGSVNLIVEDIGAAERFYVDELGLTVDPERTNRPSFVLLRAANCMVILQEAAPGGRIRNTESPIELAFEVDDVQAMRRKLGPRAVVQEMGWGDAIEITDPHGIRVSLYRWTRPGPRLSDPNESALSIPVIPGTSEYPRSEAESSPNPCTSRSPAQTASRSPRRNPADPRYPSPRD